MWVMNKGFWGKLPKPIVGLSPMDGVTDAPMRFIAKKYGQPDVIYTEFVSVEGLWRIQKRGETTHKIWNELMYDESEHPIVVQLFGSDPDSFYEATKIVAKMGFDGIDINMGCPSPGLEKRGGGAGLMRDFGLAHRVIEAVRCGVELIGSECAKDGGDCFGSSTKLAMTKGEIPVSVKTRIGSSAPDPLWWKFLAGEKLPCVAMHGRTFKQLYSGKADWEALKEAAKVIRESGTLFLGNGDVEKISIIDNGSECEKSVLDTSPEYRAVPAPCLPAGRRANFSGTPAPVTIDYLDGVLIGRAAMGNPWALRKDGYESSVKERLEVAVEHARKFEEIFLPARTVLAGLVGRGRFEMMRKHLAWYAHGFPRAGGLRRKLVQTSSADEVEEIINEFLDV